jgi:hypothetical protein
MNSKARSMLACIFGRPRLRFVNESLSGRFCGHDRSDMELDGGSCDAVDEVVEECHSLGGNRLGRADYHPGNRRATARRQRDAD